jgi:serine/threonine-protein kinase HipA
VASQQLDVYLDIKGTPAIIGTAWFTQRRSSVSTVFAYTSDHLATRGAFAIDPRLRLVSGNQHVPGLPGAFQDCAPDRWGRNLIQKRHRAQQGSSRSADLTDVDFLLGVSDESRQGALRFTRHGEAIFLDSTNKVPKLIRLPALLNAADRVDTADDLSAVKDLLDAGSGSLGGARPKASVLDTDGHLLIAKFPHQSDQWDVMAWEAVALDLAEAAGIRVPERRLITVADKRHVLLMRRFDRSHDGYRIPYMSAMTALEAADGEWHDYEEIAEAVSDIGSAAKADLRELFLRAAFNVAIHNTDDHLRNHGFLAADGAWRLSPAFDMNPNPHGSIDRVTGIAGTTSLSDAESGLADLARACRLSASEAEIIRNDVRTAVAGWRSAAQAYGVTGRELELFAEVLDRQR